MSAVYRASPRTRSGASLRTAARPTTAPGPAGHCSCGSSSTTSHTSSKRPSTSFSVRISLAQCRILLDARVRAAAADVAGHRVPDLVNGRIRIGRDQRRCRDDLTGCAEAALHRVGANERVDERMVAQAFDRRHLPAYRVCERDAREHRHTVDLHRARTAVTFVARDLRPGEADPLPQDRREAHADRSVERMSLAVDRQPELTHESSPQRCRQAG